MEERKIRVAITQGDTNGVGYEVILKVFSDPNILELCTPIIYGSPKIASYHRKALNLEVPYTIINHAEEARDGRVNLLACFDDEIKIEMGQPSQEAGAAALKALDRAMTDYRSELYDVLVTAPINKATIQSPGFHFPGHTEYIETSVGEGQKALMILMNETLRVALVTTHQGHSQSYHQRGHCREGNHFPQGTEARLPHFQSSHCRALAEPSRWRQRTAGF